MGRVRCSFSGQRNSVTLLKDSDKTSFQMEGRLKMGSVFVVLVLIGVPGFGCKNLWSVRLASNSTRARFHSALLNARKPCRKSTSVQPAPPGLRGSSAFA
ncbi:hypothetical protein OIU84_001441 [Salix udensis]|uniref:Transmembrane protein n=1 Tax=Salix udensis TaxID=889485 RepID=A0AAD6K8Z1_9ROSI|nr:hypothetical protein OIU84_001441 [Salix udensis]